MPTEIDASKIEWEKPVSIDRKAIKWESTPSEVPQGRRYSLAEVPVEAVKSLPESAKQFGQGLLSAVLSPVETLSGLMDVGAGALRNSLPKSVVNFIDKFDTTPDAAERASEAARAVGGMYKSRYGSYDAIKRTFAEDPVGAAADLSTLLTGGAGAVRGVGRAVPGMAGVAERVAAPLAQAGEAVNPLRPVGTIARIAGRVVSPVTNLTEAVFNPKNALYMRAAEGRAPEIINALRGAEEIVPGSAPTAAQAAAETGVVGFQKLGRSAAEKVLESEYKAREAEQAAAQLGTVKGVGKTQAELDAAKAVRNATVKPLYDIARETELPGREAAFRPVRTGVTKSTQMTEVESGVPRLQEMGRDPITNQPVVQPVSSVGGQPIYQQVLAGYNYEPTLAKLMERPAVNAAFDSAAISAANEGVPMFTKEGKLTGEGAHYVKLALDDAITGTSDKTAAGRNAIRAIESAKTQYVDWMESHNPPYKLARKIFEARSKNINRMEVGQFLESKLRPALGEETARLRAAGYATALEQAPGTIKKATGQSRFKSLEDVFADDPDALKQLHSVRDDLARAAKSERLQKGRISREFDVTRATEALAGDTALPNMINRVTTVANDIWRRLRGRIDKNVAIEVATEMLFPGKAADALEAALKQQQKRQAMQARTAAPFKAAGKAPAVINALRAEQESQNALAR